MKKELIFEEKEAFREWLKQYGEKHEGVWLIFGKTNNLKTLPAEEALEEALCFGWIDGLINSIDGHKYKKYFCKRQKRSKWSDKNKNLVEKLIREGRMTESGMQAIQEAKENGEWEKTHDRSISETHKDNFKARIEISDLAYKNFLAMPESTQKQFIGFYLEAKKEETRQSRLKKIINLLEQNKRLM